MLNAFLFFIVPVAYSTQDTTGVGIPPQHHEATLHHYQQLAKRLAQIPVELVHKVSSHRTLGAYYLHILLSIAVLISYLLHQNVAVCRPKSFTTGSTLSTSLSHSDSRISKSQQIATSTLFTRVIPGFRQQQE